MKRGDLDVLTLGADVRERVSSPGSSPFPNAAAKLDMTVVRLLRSGREERPSVGSTEEEEEEPLLRTLESAESKGVPSDIATPPPSP